MDRHEFNNKIMVELYKSKIKHEFDRDDKHDLTSCFIGDNDTVAMAWGKETVSIHAFEEGGGVIVPFEDLTNLSSSEKTLEIDFKGGSCKIKETEDKKLALSCQITKIKKHRTEPRPQRIRG